MLTEREKKRIRKVLSVISFNFPGNNFPSMKDVVLSRWNKDNRIRKRKPQQPKKKFFFLLNCNYFHNHLRVLFKHQLLVGKQKIIIIIKTIIIHKNLLAKFKKIYKIRQRLSKIKLFSLFHCSLFPRNFLRCSNELSFQQNLRNYI